MTKAIEALELMVVKSAATIPSYLYDKYGVTPGTAPAQARGQIQSGIRKQMPAAPAPSAIKNPWGYATAKVMPNLPEEVQTAFQGTPQQRKQQRGDLVVEGLPERYRTLGDRHATEEERIATERKLGRTHTPEELRDLVWGETADIRSEGLSKVTRDQVYRKFPELAEALYGKGDKRQQARKNIAKGVVSERYHPAISGTREEQIAMEKQLFLDQLHPSKREAVERLLSGKDVKMDDVEKVVGKKNMQHAMGTLLPKAMMSGFVNWLKSMWAKIKPFMKGLGQKAKPFFRDLGRRAAAGTKPLYAPRTY